MESGTILAAVISAAVASIGITLAKDGKVSEFRQQWIDALREDVAILIALAVRIHRIDRAVADGTYVKAPDDETVRERGNVVMYRIALRLDIQEKEGVSNESNKRRRHRVLNDALNGLRMVGQPNATATEDELKRACGNVERAASEVLDTAWRRVKSGETSYRFARYTSYAALSIALCVLVCQSVWSFYHRNDYKVTRFEIIKPITVTVQEPPPNERVAPPVQVSQNPAQTRRTTIRSLPK